MTQANRSLRARALAPCIAAVLVACSSAHDAHTGNIPPDSGPIRVAASFQHAFTLGHSTHTANDDLGVSAGATTQWRVTTRDPWIALPLTTFTGAAHVPVAVDAAGLGVGIHVGQVTVTDLADPTDSAEVTVMLSVALPALSLSPSPMTIGGADGLDIAASQPLDITLDTGDRAWPWTATVSGNWLTMSATSGTAAGSPHRVTVTADRAALAPGRYIGSIQVDAVVDGVTISRALDVGFNKEAHWLYVSSLGVAFSSVPRRSVLTRTLQVRSSQGRVDAAWAAQSDAAWLTATRSGMTGGALTLTANPAGLVVDHEYIANVTVSASDVSTTNPIVNQQRVRVGLWLGSSDPKPVVIATHDNHVVPGPVEPYVYTSGGGGQVSVYNVYSGALVTTFTSGVTRAGEMAISSDGTVLYVNDELAHQVVALDAATGADLLHIPSAANFLGTLVYARPSARPVLLIPDGTVYDLTTGATSRNGVIGGGKAIDPLDQSVYVANFGLSPSSLDKYAISYTALATPPFVSHPAASVTPGSNGQDVCVSSDGARVYSANGAPYMFLVYSAADLTPLPALAGDAYPDNAACGWNGLFLGGLSGVGSGVWVYRPDGSQVTVLLLNPGSGNELTPRTLSLSGDNTRILGSTEDATAIGQTFNIVDAPAP